MRAEEREMVAEIYVKRKADEASLGRDGTKSNSRRVVGQGDQGGANEIRQDGRTLGPIGLPESGGAAMGLGQMESWDTRNEAEGSNSYFTNGMNIPTVNKNENKKRSVKRVPRKKARRLPVRVKRRKNFWELIDEVDAGVSLAQLLATDVQAQRDAVDGIRYLRENRTKLLKEWSAKQETPGRVVNGRAGAPMEVNVVDRDWDEEEDSEGDPLDLSSLFSEDGSYNGEMGSQDSGDEDVSVYGYPYSLEQMLRSSPMRGVVTIKGKAVEAVFDTGASVSVIGQGLANSLGLVAGEDVLPLTGFDNKKGDLSPTVKDVPICIGGRIRPEHMCIQAGGNDNLCLLGIRWFKAYGIELDLAQSCVRIPTTTGTVKVQAYTTHLPEQDRSEVMNGPGSTVATLGSEARRVYMVSTGVKHSASYEEDLVPAVEDEVEVNHNGDSVCVGVPGGLAHVVEKYKECFSEVSGLGRVNGFEMDIPLVPNAEPVRSKPFRISWDEEEALKKYLDELLELGIIEPSNGLWTSPCFFVPKKDGSLRLVIDYRKLNAQVKQDAYPLPHIDDLLDAVGGCQVFSTLDCTSGYHQLSLNPAHAERTGFVTKMGTFAFNVLPFGVTTGCSQYQRMMHQILGKYIGDFILVFLDDILVYSRNMEDYERHLELLFEACKNANLRLKRKKCHFGVDKVEYLGHMVTADGVLPSGHNIDKVKNFGVPGNVGEVKSFLGLTGYYWKYVPDYADIAEPLTRLTKKNQKFYWGEEQQEAFRTFLEVLTTAPILAYPDRKMVQVLSVDASTKGLGAVLSQVEDASTMANERVVAYGSRGLKGGEVTYAPTHLEALAVVWGVTHFKHYLKGRRFVLITDHSSLVFIFRPLKATPKLSRWAACLLDYDYEIRYRPGKGNPADPLSRIGFDGDEVMAIEEKKICVPR